MSELTKLQQLVVAASDLVDALVGNFDSPSAWDNGELGKLQDLLGLNANDPKWFPVKFEVGDWVYYRDHERGAFVVTSIDRNDIFLQGLDDLTGQMIAKAPELVLLKDSDIGCRARLYPQEVLGRVIRKHFKPGATP